MPDEPAPEVDPRRKDPDEAPPANPVRMPVIDTDNGQMDVISRLLKDRILLLGQGVDDEVANVLVAQLLYLANEDPEKDITLYINSPVRFIYLCATLLGAHWCDLDSKNVIRSDLVKSSFFQNRGDPCLLVWQFMILCNMFRAMSTLCALVWLPVWELFCWERVPRESVVPCPTAVS